MVFYKMLCAMEGVKKKHQVFSKFKKREEGICTVENVRREAVL